MYSVRRWSVRHARGLEIFYNGFERVFVALHPLWKAIGYERLEKPVAVVEKAVKGFLFDCQMCGQCALSSTGMSCSMNCRWSSGHIARTSGNRTKSPSRLFPPQRRASPDAHSRWPSTA
ncbi:MAG: methylenetetrahydrofolate reductase C-terminal domain-containing protein, partial [Rhodoferax sp.]